MNKVVKGLLTIIFLLVVMLFVSVKSYAQISVELSVDKNSMALEDEVQLQIAVRGANNAGNLSVAGMDNFEIVSQSSGQSVQIVNGSMSVEKSFYYNLAPKSAGTFSLGPAILELNGSKIQSNAIEMQVFSTEGESAAEGNQSPSNESVGQDERLGERGYFVQATIDSKSAVVNQQIIYTFRFFDRVGISGANIGKWPQFEGFVKEDLGEQRRFRTVINGIEWNVTEIRHALFPTKVGTLTIEPAELVASVVDDSGRARRGGSLFGGFFGGFQQVKQVRLKTKSLSVAVSQLPSSNRPANFTGHIGRFSIQSELSKNNLMVGESATLSLSITGEGNIRDISLPPMQFEGFKIYEDKPTVDIRTDKEVVVGQKIFKYGLVPQKDGQLILPAIEFVFYNPHSGQYEVAKTESMTLQISKAVDEKLSIVQANEDNKVVDQRRAIKMLGQDLMPIKRNGSGGQWKGLPIGKRELYAVVTLSLLPLFFYLLLQVLAWRRQRFEEDRGLARKTQAYKSYKRKLASFKTGQMKVVDLSNTFRAYLGDRLDFDGMALTPNDVEKKTKDYIASSQLRTSIYELLKLFEGGIYGGEIKYSLAELITKCDLLVRKLEKEIKR
ncbi:MAG: hypothetical protein A2504_01605 [Bdellovibrionales bacterium RIFOXYD12_FULL_39_22]|nr:MAG: hypothetical protein A2385_04130 [Bdellovibrionales bacterium RIFOXYB1_FULL_39_21]OFZ42398.1 MAG: hypothetical protein A2485_15365 [Bdellovibrionales bacterium RIFOXYC12_FULL_39_17]OFZ46301.1 MAG: hypothetical protein A2404_13650 [Bdellovibrionales bacterium RIFOXYC1_FULL_39_130]OFZ75194.1 MAG: hypothetical protein A2560_15705 [Bdellovibrionales bacterium RIFOXYD1_FULL_39_84]OFZ93188.1 MAG: hypothetical protein A2504_01605 [Bdellovibrionales bacterium RIFOXYD12_FULL_39_22]HLE11101.1 Ba